MSVIENSTTTIVETPPQVVLIQMLRAAWISKAIAVAAELKIADFLKEGAKCCKDLAEATETHEDNLYRFLRALASAGVFREVEHRVFENSQLSDCLREDIPFSMRDGALSVGYEYNWMSFGNIATSLKTGKTAFDAVYGQPIFEYFQQHPELDDNFNKVMMTLNEVIVPTIIAGYDFNQFATIVDIGGGYGSISIPLLQAYPNLHGTLFDQPHVLEGAKKYVAEANLGDRLEIVDGSFFEAVPSGADCYLMKYILHDWSDEQAITILKNVRAAMGENSKVLLTEHVVPDDNMSSDAQYLDMTMMVMYGGRERSAAEYQKLLEAAGLRMTRVIPTQSTISFVEAVAI